MWTLPGDKKPAERMGIIGTLTVMIFLVVAVLLRLLLSLSSNGMWCAYSETLHRYLWMCRDFRLKRVFSINVSGHKYGLTYPGVGWAVWRSPEYLPQELIFHINYLGSDQVRTKTGLYK